MKLESEHYAKNISRRFKTYSSDMKDVWESFEFVNRYLGAIHPLVKGGSLPTFSFRSLHADSTTSVDKNRTLGYIDHVVRKVNPERSLITSVALTEDFLQDLVRTVYRAFPERIAGGNSPDAPERIEKVVAVILDSENRDEILERLGDEKVRSAFYGNPVDFFRKDKMKLEFGATFRDDYADSLEAYAEIIARRNIYAHNGGRVDRKYQKETGNQAVKLGNKLPISDVYLRESIMLLRGVSSVAAYVACDRIFNSTPKGGRLLAVYKAFSASRSF